MSNIYTYEIECKGCGTRFPAGVRHDCTVTRREFESMNDRLTKIEAALGSIGHELAPSVPWPGDPEE